MKVRFDAVGDPDLGGTPLVCHNERLADPLDSFTRAIGAISKKRAKTLEDHEAIGRLEFFGGMYTDPPLNVDKSGNIDLNGERPVIPAWNMLRCLQDGATRQKRGKDVLRGVMPLPTHAAAVIEFDGPDTLADLWQDGGFALRKTVGVQRSRTMRTRPIFNNWAASVVFEVDPAVLDLDSVAVAWADAGRYSGLGEMRPVYGRFVGTIEEAD